MYSVEDLRPTIIPKSDQLNADQLIAGDMVLSVTAVDVTTDPKQPVIVHYEGENGRPYKPCLSMRRVIIKLWGENGHAWSGRHMRVYNDPSVMYGNDKTGGIRISAMSDISSDANVTLQERRGKRVTYHIKRMDRPTDAHIYAIRNADSEEALKSAYMAAYRSTKDAAKRAQYEAAKDDRKAELIADDEKAGDAKQENSATEAFVEAHGGAD